MFFCFLVQTLDIRASPLSFENMKDYTQGDFQKVVPQQESCPTADVLVFPKEIILHMQITISSGVLTSNSSPRHFLVTQQMEKLPQQHLPRHPMGRMRFQWASHPHQIQNHTPNQNTNVDPTWRLFSFLYCKSAVPMHSQWFTQQINVRVCKTKISQCCTLASSGVLPTETVQSSSVATHRHPGKV